MRKAPSDADGVPEDQQRAAGGEGGQPVDGGGGEAASGSQRPGCSRSRQSRPPSTAEPAERNSSAGFSVSARCSGR